MPHAMIFARPGNDPLCLTVGRIAEAMAHVVKLGQQDDDERDDGFADDDEGQDDVPEDEDEDDDDDADEDEEEEDEDDNSDDGRIAPSLDSIPGVARVLRLSGASLHGGCPQVEVTIG